MHYVNCYYLTYLLNEFLAILQNCPRGNENILLKENYFWKQQWLHFWKQGNKYLFIFNTHILTRIVVLLYFCTSEMSENIRSSTFLVKNKKDSFFSIEFGKNPLSTYFIWFDKSSIHLLFVLVIFSQSYILLWLYYYYCRKRFTNVLLFVMWLYEVVNFYIYYYYFLFTTKTCIKSINIPWNGKNVKLNAESLYLILNIPSLATTTSVSSD